MLNHDAISCYGCKDHIKSGERVLQCSSEGANGTCHLGQDLIRCLGYCAVQRRACTHPSNSAQALAAVTWGNIPERQTAFIFSSLKIAQNLRNSALSFDKGQPSARSPLLGVTWAGNCTVLHEHGKTSSIFVSVNRACLTYTAGRA